MACRDPGSPPCYTLIKRDEFDGCATLEALKSSEQDFYKPIRVPKWTTIEIPIHIFEGKIEALEDLERSVLFSPGGRLQRDLDLLEYLQH